MNDQEKLAEEISRFLEGEMSQEEHSLFEERISREPELAAEVKVYQNLIGAIQEVGMDDLRAELRASLDEKIEQEKISDSRPSTKKIPVWPLLAAAVILLVLAGIWWNSSRPGKPEEAYAMNCQNRTLPIKGTENLGSNFAGDPKPDMIAINICQESGQGGVSYIFTESDSLQLFVPEADTWPSIDMQFVLDGGRYVLTYEGVEYPLDLGSSERRILIEK